MGMLVAYADAAGASDRKVAAVAGYVSTIQAWERFSVKWMKLLSTYGVRIMHRTDLETFQGEFLREKGWGEKRLRDLLPKMHSLIQEHTRTGFGVSVLTADYDHFMPTFLKRKYGGVYGWCVHECIINVAKWHEISRQQGAIDWVFENGTEGIGQILYQFHELQKDPEFYIGSVAQRPKEICPLQSSDTVAYEVFKHTENQIVDRGLRAVRFSARQLFRQDELKYFRYWDAKRIQDWIGRVHAKGVSTEY